MSEPTPPPPARDRLVVLAKAPIYGFVKTRLATALGPDAALAIYRRLAARVFIEVAAAADAGVEAEVRVTPDASAADARTWVPPRIRVRTQGPGDLGDRMRRAFDDAFAEGATRVVLIGTDCPGFTRRHAAGAFVSLAHADLVLGPATDGGYWLVGARNRTPEVFDGVPWSTPGVLPATRERAQAAGLRVFELETLDDIDTPEDLERLRGGPLGPEFRA